MARALGKAVLTVTVAFEVDEEEARALDALADNSATAIVGGFRSLRGHANGLEVFLRTIRAIVRPAIVKADEARSLIQRDVGVAT